MANSLTEKYRPRVIDQYLGQDEAKKTAQAWISGKRPLPPAILVSGPTSAGKTTMAEILARNVLCHAKKKNNDVEPCLKCPGCSLDSNPDYIYMNAGSDRGIDAFRSLAERIKVRPLGGTHKVIVLDEAGQITSAAWGAFLLPLERPPEHVKIIACTTDPQNIPPANLGRFSHLKLKPTSAEDCFGLLKSISEAENIGELGLTDTHVAAIVSSVNAQPRDAIHLLDQVYSFLIESPLSEAKSAEAHAKIVNSTIDKIVRASPQGLALALMQLVYNGKISATLDLISSNLDTADQVMKEMVQISHDFLQMMCSRTLGAKSRYASLADAIDWFKQVGDSKEVKLEKMRMAMAVYKLVNDQYLRCAGYTVKPGQLIEATLAEAVIHVFEVKERLVSANNTGAQA